MHPIIMGNLVKARTSDLHLQAERAGPSRPPHPPSASETQ